MDFKFLGRTIEINWLPGLVVGCLLDREQGTLLICIGFFAILIEY